tara:strand:+ start:257 stop:550 length:294 start_codon:yes stop_codon:yes gene_type:complete
MELQEHYEILESMSPSQVYKYMDKRRDVFTMALAMDEVPKSIVAKLDEYSETNQYKAGAAVSDAKRSVRFSLKRAWDYVCAKAYAFERYILSGWKLK